jgi:arsenite methyltransferase
MFFEEYLGLNKYAENEVFDILTTKYTKKDGIARQIKLLSEDQEQTKETFGYKWSNKHDLTKSRTSQSFSRQWLINRYLDGKEVKLEKGTNFLDAGCGSGYSASVLFDQELNKINYLGIEISHAIDKAKERFEELGIEGEFIQADIMDLPFEEPVFDIIFSEGVLHHTDSTEDAIKYLSGFLRKNGKFLFYVYKKKGPIREFSDDYIRSYIKDLDNDSAWEALLPLTKLGQSLGKLKTNIEIEEDIPMLGINKGIFDIQRFFYWNVMKMFYREDVSIEELNLTNFDWYRPSNCHRHTKEELESWCEDADLNVKRIIEEEAGFTVHALKQ